MAAGPHAPQVLGCLRSTGSASDLLADDTGGRLRVRWPLRLELVQFGGGNGQVVSVADQDRLGDRVAAGTDLATPGNGSANGNAHGSDNAWSARSASRDHHGEDVMTRHRHGLVRQLETDWQNLITSREAVAGLTRWAATEPVLAEFADLAQLRAATEDRGDKDRSDAVLAGLARWAARDGGDDQLAARVLLQLLLAGAVRLAARIAAVTGDPVEAEADVIAELTAGIRTYPWRRRPRRIAANLLLDCQQRLSRAARRAQGSVPAGLDPAGSVRQGEDTYRLADEQVEVVDLFLWAQRSGVLSAEEALLLAAHRVDEVPVRQLTDTFGRCATVLYTVRANAEDRLRAALAEAA